MFKKILGVIGFLVLSCTANAGLIVNGTEWLDMSVTNGMSRLQVEQNVLTQAEYQDYEYASVTMINDLYIKMVGAHFVANDDIASGWIVINGLTTEEEMISEWFKTIAGSTNGDSINGHLFDNYSKGYIQTERNPSMGSHQAFNAGYFNMQYNDNDEYYAFFDRAASSWANLGSPVGNAVPVSWSSNSLSHALVRSVDVPEPSTLAIFALGMFGLASRKFKKNNL
jgi:hypothetical protein